MIDHDDARRFLSLELDGELDAAQASALDDHLERCPPCTAYAARLVTVRDALGGDADPAPDVRSGVLAALAGEAARGPSGRGSARAAGDRAITVVAHHVDRPERDTRAPDPGRESTVVERAGWSRGSRVVRWLPAAACLLVGLLIGSALVGGVRSTPPPAAAQVPERIAAAQFSVRSLSARIEIVERGWNEQVPVRTFSGSLDYRAPGALALRLTDTTSYPSDAWVRDDVDLVLGEHQWWARGPRDCASTAQPGCTSPEPRLEVVDDVAPYDEGAPAPLDLVVPVRSFLRAPEPPPLGTRTVAGREALGVEVSAAQVAPLLEGLRPAGNLRQFYPADRVALWLDATTWTPLRIEVRASDDADRRTWAATRGYVERSGDEVLSVELRDPVVNGAVDGDRFAPAPAGGVRRDAGYVQVVDGVTVPGYLRVDAGGVDVDPTAIPVGLDTETTGIIGSGTGHETVVQTWAGGVGWVKVASTTGWDGTRLFGDLGSPVRRTTAADGAVTYASLDGSRLAIHTDSLDVVVTGSLDTGSLARIADAIDVRGVAVPSEWDEAATESIDSATDLLPGLLVPAPGSGFDEAAVRADGNVVTHGYAGAGSRGFVAVEAPGARLSPPLDLDVAGVVVRGVDGRFSVTRGELEWVEGDRVHRLASSTLTRAELVAIADAMVPA